jgi:hypothetical protein
MTLTVAQLVKKHADTLEEEMPDISRLQPAEWVEELSAVVGFWSTSANTRDAADELGAALSYLRDALPLDDNDPKKQVLLDKADQHLSDLSIYL